MTKKKFTLPKSEDVSETNKAILDSVEKSVGFVPNLITYFTKNETALADYLAFENRKSSLRTKEKEAVNLVTSQINGCRYCQSAHTLMGKMNGFTDEQIIELRGGTASFDSKIDALVKFTKSLIQNKGKVSDHLVDQFFGAGYTEGNMIDVVILIGSKAISNYIHNLTELEINFPIAPELEII
jgi:AhpD family alkylhydroperoxidase